MMIFLGRIAEQTARVLALVGAIGVMLMMLHVGADVLARNVLGRPIPATNEIVSRYYMVFIAFLPLAWVEQRRGMVSVEVVDWLLSPLLRRISDVAVALLACVIYCVLAYTTWGTAVSSFRAGSSVIALNYLIPVWPTYILPPVGFVLAAGVTLIRAAQIASGTPAPDPGPDASAEA